MKKMILTITTIFLLAACNQQQMNKEHIPQSIIGIVENIEIENGNRYENDKFIAEVKDKDELIEAEEIKVFDEELTDTFHISNGDDRDELVVKMRACPLDDEIDSDFYDRELVISIYDNDDSMNLIQVINDRTIGGIFLDNGIVDANFDGYLDFYYVDNRGNANYYCNFWIWNPELGKFIKSDELGTISMPDFDKVNKIVTGFWRGSAVSNETRFYRYIDTELICIRSLEMCYPEFGELEDTQRLLVKVNIEGKLKVVFDEVVVLNAEYECSACNDFFRWSELSYDGN